MRDPQGNLMQGRTRWRRFAAVLVPAVAVAGAILFGMTHGAIAASFSVSGQRFKVAADRLDGTGFKQYGLWDTTAGGERIPVAVSVIDDAVLTNLCQSVDATNPLFPFKIVLRIEAGQDEDNPATAQNLVIGLESLAGDATFTNIQIGRDAGELSGSSLLTGTFGQSASSIVIDDLQQVATSTEAGTFRLNDLSLRVLTGDDAQECF